MADQLETFEFKDPKTGDVYEIRAKDQDTAFAAYQRQLGPSVPEDMAKAAGVGVAKGAIGIPGLPGNIEALGRAGINYGAKKLGYEPPVSPETVLPTGGDLQKRVEEYTGPFYEPKTTPGKIAERVGEFAPGALFPGAVAQRLIGNVAAPAAGSMAGEKVGETVGGAFGYGDAGKAVGGVAGALLSPLAARRAAVPVPAVNPTREALANTLDQEGVRMTAGQRTGNRALQFGESTFGEYPGAGGRARAIQEGQGEDFTRAVLRRAGEQADRATPEVVDRAFTRVGGEFNRILGRNVMVVDQPLTNELQNIQRDYNALVSANNRADIVGDVINDVTTNWGPRAGGAGGVVDGAVYSDLRQRLFRAARGTDDVNLSRTLWNMREALDDAFERSLAVAGRQAEIPAWQAARDQYRNLLVVERAAAAPGAAAGLLSPAQVRQGVVGQNKRAYVRGEGDMNDLVHAGDEILKPLPNSGTPARLAWTAVPQGLAGGAGAFIGGMPGAGVGMLAGTAAPALTGRMIMSPLGQAYLGNTGRGAATRAAAGEIDAVAAALAQSPALAGQAAGNDYFVNKDGQLEINIRRK